MKYFCVEIVNFAVFVIVSVQLFPDAVALLKLSLCCFQ